MSRRSTSARTGAHEQVRFAGLTRFESGDHAFDTRRHGVWRRSGYSQVMTPAIILHFSAGGVAILSGAAALCVAKGGRLHRAFGTVFFAFMLITAAMATYLALTIPGQGSNVYGGVFTLYLVATAWMTVRRKEGSVGQFEMAALLVPLGMSGIFLLLLLQSAKGPAIGADGPPAFATYVFLVVALIAGAGDLKVILRRGISGAPRIARHLWRMCTALFVGTGSFFIGQQKVMPAFIQGSPILLVLGFAPLVVMVFWLIRVRLTSWHRSEAVA
jgi:uncharacterized membrane protein